MFYSNSTKYRKQLKESVPYEQFLFFMKENLLIAIIIYLAGRAGLEPASRLNGGCLANTCLTI